MLKFVNSHPNGLPEKRKQSQRACAACRKRKRRCHHEIDGHSVENETTGSTSPPPRLEEVESMHLISPNQGTSAISPSSPLRPATGRTQRNDQESAILDHNGSPFQTNRSPMAQNRARHLSRSSNEFGSVDHRFIGDLNPESTFLAADSPPDNSNVGFWVRDARTGATERYYSKFSMRQPRSAAFSSLDPMIHQFVLPYLEGWCLSLIPSQVDYAALYSIYNKKVHPILPVLDRDSFEAMEPSDPAAIVLKQGICLVASKHNSARNYLGLPGREGTSHEEYGRNVSLAMRTSLDLGLVTDKKTLLQAYCLLYLFFQGTEGGDLPAELCSRAVHNALTIGAHVSSPNDDEQYSEKLFCSIWALDILNAAFHGRPVLMHARDFGRDLAATIARQQPCFQLFLRVVKILDAVIELYRPSSSSAASNFETEFPSFEELTVASGDVRLESSLLATIEVLYHTVAILSHREKASGPSTRSSSSGVRQALSASRITSIVGQEFHNQLSMLPFIPYAVSLSLSTAYRELRQSRVPMYQARALNQLYANCKLLEELGRVFWAASALADMIKQIIQEMDRIISTASQSHVVPRSRRASRRNSETNPPMVEPEEFILPVNEPFDASFFENIEQLDIFEQFAPDIDLPAFDNTLYGNLDLRSFF